jgi:hypothetical protein
MTVLPFVRAILVIARWRGLYGLSREGEEMNTGGRIQDSPLRL